MFDLGQVLCRDETASSCINQEPLKMYFQSEYFDAEEGTISTIKDFHDTFSQLEVTIARNILHTTSTPPQTFYSIDSITPNAKHAGNQTSSSEKSLQIVVRLATTMNVY